jgi:hypothetical protein
MDHTVGCSCKSLIHTVACLKVMVPGTCSSLLIEKGRVEKFRYLGTTLTNQNSIQDEIKSRLKSGNSCYHSVQNFCLLVCYPKI